MAAEVAIVLLLAFGVSVGGGLLLYSLVRSEHDRRTVTSRADGEQLARSDTDDDRH